MIGFIIGCILGANIGLILISIFKVNPKTCLHCGENDSDYCETCYQKLVATNIKLQCEKDELQKELNEIYKHIPMIN